MKHAFRPRQLSPRSFTRDLSGATAVEFGVTGLMFTMVFCFIIEFGLLMFTQAALDEATRVASRLLRTGSVTAGGGSTFVAALCAKLSFLQGCASSIQYNVVSGSAFASISTTITTNSANQMTGTQFTPGTAGQDVVVQVGWTHALVLPFVSSFMGKNGNVLLVSTVAYQNEPF